MISVSLLKLTLLLGIIGTNILCFSVHQNPCPFVNKKLRFAHRGGDFTRFQENTLAICKDAARNGYSIEVDLMHLRSGHVILYHDDNLEAKTGVNLNTSGATWDQVKGLRYQKKFEGKSYENSCAITLLSTMLNEVCKINKNIGLWFDIKEALTDDYGKAILNAIDDSPCSCSDEQVIVAEVYVQTRAMSNFKNEAKKHRCSKVYGAFEYFEFHSRSGPYNTFKNKVDQVAGVADFIDAHATVWKAYPQLMEDLNASGICTSVFSDDSLEDFKDPSVKMNLLIEDIAFPAAIIPEWEQIDDCANYDELQEELEKIANQALKKISEDVPNVPPSSTNSTNSESEINNPNIHPTPHTTEKFLHLHSGEN